MITVDIAADLNDEDGTGRFRESCGHHALDALCVHISTAKGVDDRLESVFWIGVGTTSKEVDMGKFVFGPSGDDEVGFSQDKDAGDAVGLKQHR